MIEKLKASCIICNKDIFYRPSRIKYRIPKTCSKACMGLLARKRIKRNCLTCGKEFETVPSQDKLGKGKFCSKGCVKLLTPRPRNDFSINCNHCGNPYLVKKYQLKFSKFCSEKCQQSFKRTTIGPQNPNYKNGRNQFILFALAHRNDNCVICQLKNKIEVHHIDGNDQHNESSNWIVICKRCHTRIHILSKKNNLSLPDALERFRKLRLFTLNRNEFRRFWLKNL